MEPAQTSILFHPLSPFSTCICECTPLSSSWSSPLSSRLQSPQQLGYQWSIWACWAWASLSCRWARPGSERGRLGSHWEFFRGQLRSRDSCPRCTLLSPIRNHTQRNYSPKWRSSWLWILSKRPLLPFQVCTVPRRTYKTVDLCTQIVWRVVEVRVWPVSRSKRALLPQPYCSHIRSCSSFYCGSGCHSRSESSCSRPWLCVTSPTLCSRLLGAAPCLVKSTIYSDRHRPMSSDSYHRLHHQGSCRVSYELCSWQEPVSTHITRLESSWSLQKLY